MRLTADTLMEADAVAHARRIAREFGVEADSVRDATPDEVRAYDRHGRIFHSIDRQSMVDHFVVSNDKGKQVFVRVITPNLYERNISKAAMHLVGAVPLLGPLVQLLYGLSHHVRAQLKPHEGDRSEQHLAGFRADINAISGAALTCSPLLMGASGLVMVPVTLLAQTGIQLGLAGKDLLDSAMDLSDLLLDWRSRGTLIT